ncbi:growth-regulating factor 1 isoform X2 [Medicago truncatula]|uniref:growth-regulating factor 1 isoform X2 n=1 Tax=Medicago truncatula TaxID=3880 RepID=UPI000D2F3AD1|nr:growth-regulating factor 1 isoform X2 [Medicago truncatula]
MMNGRNRYPFTPTQWQELEHQALIYKYMASGISIPPDLLLTIKRSYLDSSRLSPHQSQHFGWNYLPMGLGRKIDPEPGRCRRTDGKKWRCSKEAYPDSKYCERHMHRGKNRSRKPVEVLKTTNTDAPAATSTILSITKNSSLDSDHNTAALTSTTHDTNYHYPQHSSYASSHLNHSFLYHNPPSSRPNFSFQDNSAPLFLDSNGSSSHNNNNTDCRYVYGLKEEVDEHAFFTEPSGTIRSLSASSMDDSWQLTPLTISSSSSFKQRNCSGLSNDNEYSYLQLDNNSKQPQQDQGCYISGSEETFMKHGKEEPQKIFHRFFDEWPPKSSRNSWLDLDDKSSTTQLSISIPTSSHDFTTFSSTNQRDG